ncbi:FxSxx-COOH system tetratricopeptide repeat protein [Streptomyces torulosus]|uniref:FxSxx-COOH system tetratricopeptide repeat protein n=1 Tax=Streptomyces torulosus TaxID=68276 RepID=UPI0006EB93A3|nr:FxSxx-COOH system tetratricopeptide repeat protein [Streptomyces torulosus]
MRDADIGDWVTGAGPCLSAAIGVYGEAVLTRAEGDVRDSTVDLGRRILRTVWRRGDESGRRALVQAVAEAAEEPENPDAAGALRQLLKRALRADAELRAELAAVLPVPGPGPARPAHTPQASPGGPEALTNTRASGIRSIGAATIGTAVSGDVVSLPTDALYAPDKVNAAHGMSNLAPVGLCVGRDAELAWLRRNLTRQGESAIAQAGTVHGLGGVGKTTLALHYAHRHRGEYTLIWWIRAESPDLIARSLAELTQELVPAWAADAGQQAQVVWARQWLRWHPGWLLIYDNVEEPADLAPYLGSLNGGHHLATSRRTRGWPDSAPTLTLGTLPPDDAVDLLCTLVLRNSTPTPRQVAAARALAIDLGHLPLALKQAGAYLAQNPGITMDAYRRSLGKKLGRGADGLTDEHTINRIWQVTLHTLAQRDRLAVDVLYTAAWLAPDDIPHALLMPPATSPETLAEALGTLAAYSMATVTETSVSVHRLVQTVLRSPSAARLSGTGGRPHHTGRRRAERAVLRTLTSAAGPDRASEGQWDTLIPHLVALAATSPHGHRNDPLTDWYEETAQRMHEQGHSARTVPLYAAVLAQREQTLGDLDPDTLTSRSDLAAAYEVSGDLGRAIPLHEATLAQRERVLGDAHPDTLRSRSNLAIAYEAAGDLGRAVPLHEKTLAQSEQVLGDTHSDTLISRSNLANVYRVAGNFERAIRLHELTLRQRERVLGDMHRDTLTSRNALASVYRMAGDLERAVALHETTLAQREQVLGDMHPDTLMCRSNLAVAYEVSGDLGRAIPLHEKTLAQSEQVLGDRHPDTLMCRSNLAIAYEVSGDLGRAIPLHEATLAQSERVLGDRHPDTLIRRSNLAIAYEVSGDVRRAIPLHEATLAHSARILGDTHPETLRFRSHVALAHQAAGDLGRAVLLHEESLGQHERIFGDVHPDTLRSRHALAYTYAEMGNPRRAVPLCERTLTQHEQVFGDLHPDTLNIRDTLAYAYVTAGMVERAVPLAERVLAQRVRVLGDTHPDTLHSRNTVAFAHRAAGDLERATRLYETTLAQREHLLGESHPDTLHSRGQLAGACLAAGEPERALPLYRACLAVYARVLGDTHPDTLNSHMNVAIAERAVQDIP